MSQQEIKIPKHVVESAVSLLKSYKPLDVEKSLRKRGYSKLMARSAVNEAITCRRRHYQSNNNPNKD